LNAEETQDSADGAQGDAENAFMSAFMEKAERELPSDDKWIAVQLATLFGPLRDSYPKIVESSTFNREQFQGELFRACQHFYFGARAHTEFSTDELLDELDFEFGDSFPFSPYATPVLEKFRADVIKMYSRFSEPEKESTDSEPGPKEGLLDESQAIKPEPYTQKVSQKSVYQPFEDAVIRGDLLRHGQKYRVKKSLRLFADSMPFETLTKALVQEFILNFEGNEYKTRTIEDTVTRNRWKKPKAARTP